MPNLNSIATYVVVNKGLYEDMWRESEVCGISNIGPCVPSFFRQIVPKQQQSRTPQSLKEVYGKPLRKWPIGTANRAQWDCG